MKYFLDTMSCRKRSSIGRNGLEKMTKRSAGCDDSIGPLFADRITSAPSPRNVFPTVHGHWVNRPRPSIRSDPTSPSPHGIPSAPPTHDQPQCARRGSDLGAHRNGFGELGSGAPLAARTADPAFEEREGKPPKAH